MSHGAEFPECAINADQSQEPSKSFSLEPDSDQNLSFFLISWKRIILISWFPYALLEEKVLQPLCDQLYMYNIYS